MRLRIPNFITPYSAHFVPTSEPASFDELRSGRLNVFRLVECSINAEDQETLAPVNPTARVILRQATHHVF
jgi:RNase P/RNase MRP subunit p30